LPGDVGPLLAAYEFFDYLTVTGFLTKTGDSYALTPTSAVFLNRHSPHCMASMVQFVNSPQLMAGFAHLTETVRQGTTQLHRGGLSSGTRRQSAASCVGCGAGHGLFGIAVARRVPQAEIVAQDWPPVLEVAKKNAHTAGISQRYQELPGDVFAVELGGGYDVVLLTNLLHHFDPQACIRLLRKLHASLTPEGRLFTLEFVPNEDRISPPIPAMFSLMMLGLTPAGDAYTGKQHEEMLREAGFRENQLIPVPQSPQHVIVSIK
jgi:2-polyprenyl-3-methyl-5-hydroxy-6-metoxy-1,4-benzoquinol methylase